MVPADYLKRPYTRLVVPEEDGSFRGEILEFPGCIVLGETPARAYELLEEVAESWIESALARKQSIPEPMGNDDFSGKLVLRLPRQLHRKAAIAAERDGVSLNTYITSAVAISVGEGQARLTLPVLHAPAATSGATLYFAHFAYGKGGAANQAVRAMTFGMPEIALTPWAGAKGA